MNKLLFILILVLIVMVPLFGQTIEEKYFTQAKNNFAIKDFDKAYTYVNFLLKFYDDGVLPEEVTVLAEKIYFEYIQYLVTNKELPVLDQVQLTLSNFPEVKSARIDQFIQQTYDQIAFEKQMKAEELLRDQRIQEEKAKTEDQAKWKLTELEQQKVLNEQMLEMKRLELEELAKRDEMLKVDLEYRQEIEVKDQQQQEDFNRTLLTLVAAGQVEEKTGLSTGGIIGISVGGGVVLIVLVLIILLFLRSSQQQQQFHEYSMRQAQQPREMISIPMYTAPITDPAHIIEHRQERALPPPVDQDTDKLKDLLEKCRGYAIKIDAFTNRKNTSRNVAELIYKVSKHLGYDDYECMIFLAIGLVYDIGFLALNPSIFQGQEISEEQFGVIKTHPKEGLKMITFVEPEYQNLFTEGILKHHENLDGSGYPEGLSGDQIPYIARLIRAAESFEAMTSFREFKEIKNKTEAMKILYEQKNLYDAEILEAIDSIM